LPLITSVKKSNVPESVPAPYSFSGTFGKLGRMSLQLSTFEPVSQIFFSSAVVRQFAQVFCRFTTSEIPSFATVKATQRTPFSRQFAYSDDLIGREAFARSISPRQKRSKPPPVPEMPTVMRTFGFFFWNISAAAVVHGPTVLEPSALMLPLTAAVAAAVTSNAASPTTAITLFFITPLSRSFPSVP
jgi:hypothetical protein